MAALAGFGGRELDLDRQKKESDTFAMLILVAIVFILVNRLKGPGSLEFGYSGPGSLEFGYSSPGSRGNGYSSPGPRGTGYSSPGSRENGYSSPGPRKNGYSIDLRVSPKRATTPTFDFKKIDGELDGRLSAHAGCKRRLRGTTLRFARNADAPRLRSPSTQEDIFDLGQVRQRQLIVCTGSVQEKVRLPRTMIEDA